MKKRKKVAKKDVKLVRHLEGIYPERIGTVDAGAIGSSWFKVTKSASGGTKVMFDKDKLDKIERAGGLLSRVIQVAKSGQVLSEDAQKAVGQDLVEVQTLLGIESKVPGLKEALTDTKKLVSQGIEDSNDLNMTESLENVGTSLDKIMDMFKEEEVKPEAAPGQVADTPIPPVAAPVSTATAAPAPSVVPAPAPALTAAPAAVAPVAAPAPVATPAAPEGTGAAGAPVPAPVAVPTPIVGAPDGNVPVTKSDLQAFAEGFGQKMQAEVAAAVKPLTEALVAKGLGPSIVPSPVQVPASVPPISAAASSDEYDEDPLAFDDLNEEIKRDREARRERASRR